MTKLYDLAADYAKVKDLLESEDIEPEVMQDTLEAIEGAMEAKAKNIAILVQGLGSDAEIIKTEERRLAQRRKTIENKQKWLKDYLKNQMEYAGIDKFKTPTHTISLQKNPPALNITDAESVPAPYMILIPERWEIDKDAVKQALKDGQEVPGAELTQGRSLRIR